METNQAEENLKVIRTIMERAALYRRRLGPIMLVPGVVGVALGVAGSFVGIDQQSTFVGTWMGAAVMTLLACLMISRSQAKGEGEAVFSPSSRAVLESLLPSLFLGAGISLVTAFTSFTGEMTLFRTVFTIVIWTGLYGVGLISAGKFTSRGIRQLGWLFAATSLLLFLLTTQGKLVLTSEVATMRLITPRSDSLFIAANPNFIMAMTFGGFHLIAAAYLFVTEKRGSST